MISLNCLSTAKKALLSFGNCRWMSGALKMLSRYIHCFWHSHHWSSTFPKCFNWPSSLSTSARMPVTYLHANWLKGWLLSKSSFALHTSNINSFMTRQSNTKWPQRHHHVSFYITLCWIIVSWNFRVFTSTCTYAFSSKEKKMNKIIIHFNDVTMSLLSSSLLSFLIILFSINP